MRLLRGSLQVSLKLTACSVLLATGSNVASAASVSVANANVVFATTNARSSQNQQAPNQLSQNQSTADKIVAVHKFVYENQAQKHGWPANYTALWCPTNIFNLLRRLDEAKVDLSSAQVLYVVPASVAVHKGESDIRPRAARQGREGPIREWTFHVVLLIDGKILDLDFTNDPVVVDVSEYFARMFGKGPLATQKSKQDLYVRSIPAADYYSSYSGNWDWYLKGGGGRFPAMAVETLFPLIQVAN